MGKDKQKKLNQDYADFLVAFEEAKAQGTPLGGFIAWLHATGRVGIRIPRRGES